MCKIVVSAATWLEICSYLCKIFAKRRLQVVAKVRVDLLRVPPILHCVARTPRKYGAQLLPLAVFAKASLVLGWRPIDRSAAGKRWTELVR